MSDNKPTEQQKHLDFTARFYVTCPPLSRTTIRSGHNDSAHMCDAIAADILAEHTRRGRTTKHGQALAAAVKRAGDAIWQMRDVVLPDLVKAKE